MKNTTWLSGLELNRLQMHSYSTWMKYCLQLPATESFSLLPSFNERQTNSYHFLPILQIPHPSTPSSFVIGPDNNTLSKIRGVACNNGYYPGRNSYHHGLEVLESACTWWQRDNSEGDPTGSVFSWTGIRHTQHLYWGFRGFVRPWTVVNCSECDRHEWPHDINLHYNTTGIAVYVGKKMLCEQHFAYLRCL